MSESNPDPVPDQENAQSVERPGLIEVHQGDKVVAAPGSEAAVFARSGAEVHYYFPVHVVMAGDVTNETRSAIETSVCKALYKALS